MQRCPTPLFKKPTPEKPPHIPRLDDAKERGQPSSRAAKQPGSQAARQPDEPQEVATSRIANCHSGKDEDSVFIPKCGNQQVGSLLKIQQLSGLQSYIYTFGGSQPDFSGKYLDVVV
jgi:hypothetical protein